jgi:hypothetical protein
LSTPREFTANVSRTRQCVTCDRGTFGPKKNTYFERAKLLAPPPSVRAKEVELDLQVRWLFPLCADCAYVMRRSREWYRRTTFVGEFENEMLALCEQMAKRKRRSRKLDNTQGNREKALKDLLSVLKATE